MSVATLFRDALFVMISNLEAVASAVYLKA